MRRGYFLPILLLSRLGTQGRLVFLMNWYPSPHFLDLSYTPCLHHQTTHKAIISQTKLEQHSIQVHNSRRPLNHLTLTLTLTCGLIFIGIMMDYPCAKFVDFSFSCLGFIVQTNRQTDTESQTEMIAILTQLPWAWVIQLAIHLRERLVPRRCESSEEPTEVLDSFLPNSSEILACLACTVVPPQNSVSKTTRAK